jgi:hypothetical protein
MTEPHSYPQPGPAEPPAGYEAPDLWDDDEGQLPARRRRRWRLITPLTGALLALLLVSLGFTAGALVERSKAGTGSASSGAPGGFQRRAGGFGGGGGGTGGGLVGQVANLSGRTVYLTDSQGNTVKVRVPRGATVTKTSSAGLAAINPGDSLVVQGARAKDGTMIAGSVRATASSVNGGSGLSALFGAGGGGAPGGGGGAPGGTP